jgi:hypothetical protein
MSCELTREAYEADTHEPLTIGPVPTRKTWFAVVGAHPDFVVPSHLTDDRKIAEAHALIKNSEVPGLGPWHVVVLTENLHVPAP